MKKILMIGDLPNSIIGLSIADEILYDLKKTPNLL